MSYKSPYVTLATESTAGAKYWQHPDGWAKLVEFIVGRGYAVVNVSRQGSLRPEFERWKIPLALNHPNGSIRSAAGCIAGSEMFIGVSSGLAWLAWALNKPVVMISGFTKPFNEFECIRIINEKVCNGCYHHNLFNAGDWDWCPVHKGTPRQFECTKTITPEMVIARISDLLPQI